MQLLVLAAGKGRRMGAGREDLPKFLREFSGVEPALPRLLRHAKAAGIGPVTVLTRDEDQCQTVNATKEYEFTNVVGLESPGHTAGETLLQQFPGVRKSGTYIAHGDTWFANNPFTLHSDEESLAIGGGESIVLDQPLGYLINNSGHLVVDYTTRRLAGSLLAWTGLWFCPMAAELPNPPQNNARILVESIVSQMTAELNWTVKPVGAFANINTPEDADSLVRYIK